MQGIKGLIVAAVLGLAGAALNWMYLAQKKTEISMVSFVGVAEDRSLRLGETFEKDDLVEVQIPLNNVGELRRFAVPYDGTRSIEAVVGMPAVRNFNGGELLLRQDLDKPPPPELKFESKNERAMFVPVDTRSFVPSLVVPGSYVSFVVPRTGPTLAVDAEDADSDSPPRRSASRSDSYPLETIGPFRILSLGNRLGTTEVMKAAGSPQVQENVMTISVKLEGGDLEPKAKKLWTLLQRSDSRQAGVILHPPDHVGAGP